MKKKYKEIRINELINQAVMDNITFGNAIKKEETLQAGKKTACLVGEETVKVNNILSLQKYLNNG